MSAASPLAGGGPEYETPFVESIRLERVLVGEFPDPLPKRDVLALVAYVQLTGRFNEKHANLFRPTPSPTRQKADFEADFWKVLDEEGHERPAHFRRSRLVSAVMTSENGSGRSFSYTRSYFVPNCMGDAFKTAYETLVDRIARYGAGSVELARWIEAQIKVFDQCSGEASFDPPGEPPSDWLPLERHDRHYQIAASYFYNRRYLEAASRFREIGRTPDSPWRDLGRYLVARSLAREATVNENDPERHLQLALEHHRELAEETEYVAAFPSVRGQIRYVEAKLAPVALRHELEQRIIDEPGDVSATDRGVSRHLLRRANLDEDAATEFEAWYRLATVPQPERVIRHRRNEQSLAWLYLALAQAQAGHGKTTLNDLLRAADALSRDTPDHFNMLLHRIRIRGLIGEADVALRWAEDTLDDDLTRSDGNRLRNAVARIALNWADYFRWAPLTRISHQGP